MLEIPFSGIKKIEELIKNSNEYISLSQGAIRVGGIPQQIKTYVQQLLETDATDYYGSCWGMQLLREKLAFVLSHQYQTTVRTSNIIPTHGCIGGLSLLYLSILHPDDEVIIPEPSYPAYEILTKATRARAVYVSVAQSNGEWVLDVEKIKSATTPRTKIIIFSNPWNPLGIVVPQETIQALVAWCELKGIFLIIDEAYNNYVFDCSLPAIVPLVVQSEWVISANTFSKNMAMSGWRIGYLVLPERIGRVLAGMQDALLNCLNNTAQYAALYALDHPEIAQAFLTIVHHNRNRAITQLAPLFEMQIPRGGFFLFLKTPAEDATELCTSLLNKAKVAVVPGITFGPSGAPYLRICYARDTQVLERGSIEY